MERRPAKEEGFTLIELTAVVAIVGILAALAIVSYRHFTWKAKNVEAEVALVEVHRLQQMHLANTGSYSVDFGAIRVQSRSASQVLFRQSSAYGRSGRNRLPGFRDAEASR